MATPFFQLPATMTGLYWKVSLKLVKRCLHTQKKEIVHLSESQGEEG